MTIDAHNELYADEERLASAALQIGRDWKNSPYYTAAEQAMERQWNEMIWPFIMGAKECSIDFSATMELAAGRGRNTVKLLPLAGKLLLVDINENNISFLRKRFQNEPKVHYYVNNGYSLPFLGDATISFIYCFDSMVHFDSDVVRSYLSEFSRILKPGGCGFIHHSNFVGNPGGDPHCNPGWRNFMSQELFAHYVYKEGMSVIRQKSVDWKSDGILIDCFTLFRSNEL